MVETRVRRQGPIGQDRIGAGTFEVTDKTLDFSFRLIARSRICSYSLGKALRPPRHQ